MKKYLNIREVSQMLGLEEYTIRYWDSLNPKTNKLRFEGLSTKSKKGTRYFNIENINKLKQLKELLYDNGKQNYTHNLANKLMIINKKRSDLDKNFNENEYLIKLDNHEKIDQILKKMRFLLKKS